MRLATFSRSGRILLAGMAACTAIGLTAGPALAAATWTITPGGAVSLAARNPTIKDTRSGTTLTCTAGSLTGTLKSGGGLTGTAAGSINGGTVSGCGGPLGIKFTVTLLDLPWHINLTSYDGGTGVVHGTISHMEIRVTGSGCSFVIDGTRAGASDGMVRFTYSDSTHQVKTSGGNLHIYDVTGCFGLVANGDPAALTTSFTITPAQSITSP